jgi:transmembrane sensor
MTTPIDGSTMEQAGAWCLRLADGPLAEHERRQFEQWLGADAANTRAFESVTRAWHAVEQVAAEPELIDLRREALDQLQRAQASRWRSAQRPSRRWLGLAAALMLAVLGSALWMQWMPQRYQTGVGERQLVQLEDGSQLSLDADSRVDVRFDRDRRELWLRQGRARFQVARDPLRPFSVSAADKLVVATGTEFSVELVSSQMHVILYEGSVEVMGQREGRVEPLQASPEPDADTASTPALATAAPARLAPGSELVAQLDRPEVRLREIDAARTRTWESGQLVFNDEPLAAAVERMNRYGRERVRLGDAQVGEIRISGTFSAGDTAAFVEGVSGVFALRAERRTGEVVLSRKR